MLLVILQILIYLNLIGLKENVIIGKLIPVGTGMKRYRNTKLNTDETETISFDELDMEDEVDFDEDMELTDLEESGEALDSEETDEVEEATEEMVAVAEDNE